MHECCAKKDEVPDSGQKVSAKASGLSSQSDGDSVKSEEPNESQEGKGWLLVALVAILAMIALYNEMQLLSLGSTAALLVKSGAALSTAGQGVPVTGSAGSAILSGPDVLPKGIPAVYGSELGVSYNDISASNPGLADQTINKLGAFDASLQLSGDKLSRYIAVASQISCEYCCGAPSIIFSNGQAACGCAHSAAMRGLAKYLLLNHPEMSDLQILQEMGKWKVLFFPGPMATKAGVMQQKGLPMDYANLASNKYRGIESGASVPGSAGGSGGQVGGC